MSKKMRIAIDESLMNTIWTKYKRQGQIIYVIMLHQQIIQKQAKTTRKKNIRSANQKESIKCIIEPKETIKYLMIQIIVLG